MPLLELPTGKTLDGTENRNCSHNAWIPKFGDLNVLSYSQTYLQV